MPTLMMIIIEAIIITATTGVSPTIMIIMNGRGVVLLCSRLFYLSSGTFSVVVEGRKGKQGRHLILDLLHSRHIGADHVVGEEVGEVVGDLHLEAVGFGLV